MHRILSDSLHLPKIISLVGKGPCEWFSLQINGHGTQQGAPFPKTHDVLCLGLSQHQNGKILNPRSSHSRRNATKKPSARARIFSPPAQKVGPAKNSYPLNASPLGRLNLGGVFWDGMFLGVLGAVVAKSRDAGLLFDSDPGDLYIREHHVETLC